MDPILSLFPRRQRSQVSQAVVFARHHAMQKGITKQNLRKTIAQKLLSRRSLAHQSYYQFFQPQLFTYEHHHDPHTALTDEQGEEGFADAEESSDDQFEADLEGDDDDRGFTAETTITTVEDESRSAEQWHDAGSLCGGLIHPHLVDSSHAPHPIDDAANASGGWGNYRLYHYSETAHQPQPQSDQQSHFEAQKEEEGEEEQDLPYLSDAAYSQDAWWTEEIEMGSQFDDDCESVAYGHDHCEEDEEEDDEEGISFDEHDMSIYLTDFEEMTEGGEADDEEDETCAVLITFEPSEKVQIADHQPLCSEIAMSKKRYSQRADSMYHGLNENGEKEESNGAAEKEQNIDSEEEEIEIEIDDLEEDETVEGTIVFQHSLGEATDDEEEEEEEEDDDEAELDVTLLSELADDEGDVMDANTEALLSSFLHLKDDMHILAT